jgi:methyl-accepting chemotaxis protein
VLRSVLRPVAELETGTARLGAGDLDYRVPEHGHNELGLLAGAFNSMARDLLESYNDLTGEIATRKEIEEELRRHRDRLEEIVEERTAELRDAMDELSRSNAELEEVRR